MSRTPTVEELEQLFLLPERLERRDDTVARLKKEEQPKPIAATVREPRATPQERWD